VLDRVAGAQVGRKVSLPVASQQALPENGTGLREDASGRDEVELERPPLESARDGQNEYNGQPPSLHVIEDRKH